MTKFTITFKNVQTAEYMFYNVEITVVESDVKKIIELYTEVRDICSRLITIDNPCDKPVEIKADQFIIDNENVFITPPAITIPPHRVNFNVFSKLTRLVRKVDLKLISVHYWWVLKRAHWY